MSFCNSTMADNVLSSPQAMYFRKSLSYRALSYRRAELTPTPQPFCNFRRTAPMSPHKPVAIMANIPGSGVAKFMLGPFWVEMCN
jgi:hypothetical protein